MHIDYAFWSDSDRLEVDHYSVSYHWVYNPIADYWRSNSILERDCKASERPWKPWRKECEFSITTIMLSWISTHSCVISIMICNRPWLLKRHLLCGDKKKIVYIDLWLRLLLCQNVVRGCLCGSEHLPCIYRTNWFWLDYIVLSLHTC